MIRLIKKIVSLSSKIDTCSSDIERKENTEMLNELLVVHEKLPAIIEEVENRNQSHTRNLVITIDSREDIDDIDDASSKLRLSREEIVVSAIRMISALYLD